MVEDDHRRREERIMSMPRRWVLILAGSATVALCVYLAWPAGQPTVENFERLRQGMSRAEVEAIVGPPGDYRSAPTALFNGRVWWPDEGAYWQTDHATYVVVYDHTGREMLNSGLGARTVANLSLFESAVWRIKRAWRNLYPGEPKAPR